MGAYYHDLPICPTCCKSPNIAEGSYIDIPNGEGGSRICSECKVKFKASINLEGRCVFHDLSILISSNGWIDPSKVPLFWRIWPNRIERDYLEWVRNPRPGNHLVTWPWPEVRFAPLLAFEFLEANPKCKVLIVDSLGPNRNETDTIYSFDLVDRIGGLYKTTEDIDQKSIQKDPGNKKAWHSLSKVDILEKQLTTEYYVTRAGKDHDYAVDRSRVERHGIMPFRLSTCEGRIVKEIAEEVGKDRIRKVTRIKAGKSKVIKTLNPNGVYDIRLDEEERWVKDVTRTISKDDFWNIVLQRTRPRRAGDFILAAPQNNESIPAIKDDSNLIIVDISSSDTDYRAVSEFIYKVGPDLIIIPDSDMMMQDRCFNGLRSETLLEMMRSNNGKTILMFSTDPSKRYLYNLEHNHSSGSGLILHPWDNALVLGSIEKELEECSEREGPYSTSSGDLHVQRRPLNIEYRSLEVLAPLEDAVNRTLEKIKDDQDWSSSNNFFQDLLRTPLNIRGDYTKDPKAFYRNCDGQDLTYDNIIPRLERNPIVGQDIEPLTKALDVAYATSDVAPKNPLFDMTVEIARDRLSSIKGSVHLIVHGLDVRGMIEKLKGSILSDEVDVRLFVHRWSRLPSGLCTSDWVISLMPPAYDYSLSSGGAGGYTFLASPLRIERIRRMIENRLDECHSRPLFFPEDYQSVSNTMTSILTSIEKTKELTNDELEEVASVLELERKQSRSQVASGTRTSYSTILEKGSKVILIRDAYGRGIFLPTNATILISSKDGIEELKLKGNENEKELSMQIGNKQIFYNKHGLYVSFKSIFTKYMCLHGKIKIGLGDRQWPDFLSFQRTAFHWNQCLKMAADRIRMENKISCDEANRRQAIALSRLDLNAKNIEYIESWWTDSETIDLGNGESITVYSTEHPRSLSDMKKIFDFLRPTLKDVDLSEEMADTSYSAAIRIQSIRSSVLTHKIEKVSPMRSLLKGLEMDFAKILSEMDKIVVHSIQSEKLMVDVDGYKMISKEEITKIINPDFDT